MKIKCFRDLNIWKLGKEIVKETYHITDSFPSSEKFGLTSQIRRSSVSIPSNIAEGFNRYKNNEYRRFLFMALGSCAELETQVEISKDLKFLVKAEELIDKINHESRMIQALINKL